jgi:hypothetical protein
MNRYRDTVNEELYDLSPRPSLFKMNESVRRENTQAEFCGVG